MWETRLLDESGLYFQSTQYIQDKQGQAQRWHNLAGSEFFHDSRLAWHVDRAAYVDTTIQNAYLKGYQQFATRRPVWEVLEHVLASPMLR